MERVCISRLAKPQKLVKLERSAKYKTFSYLTVLTSHFRGGSSKISFFFTLDKQKRVFISVPHQPDWSSFSSAFKARCTLMALDMLSIYVFKIV